MKPKRKNIIKFIYFKILFTGIFLFTNNLFSQNQQLKICFVNRKSVVLNNIYNIEGSVKNISSLIKQKDSILGNGNDCGDWLEEEHHILYANKLVIEFNNKLYAINKILSSKNGNSIRINKKLIIDYTYSIDMFERDFCKKICAG